MKLQTRIKAGRPNPNHNTIVRYPSWGMCRSREVRSCPENIQHLNPKENSMNLKTKIKAGRLAANHNTIVR